MAQRGAGRLAEARVTQELAVAVRPQDAAFVYNLALLCHALGDSAMAQTCCGRALVLAPDFTPARQLRGELAAATNA
jgi:Flp pilus assembly protein TadD